MMLYHFYDVISFQCRIKLNLGALYPINMILIYRFDSCPVQPDWIVRQSIPVCSTCLLKPLSKTCKKTDLQSKANCFKTFKICLRCLPISMHFFRTWELCGTRWEAKPRALINLGALHSHSADPNSTKKRPNCSCKILD